MSRLRTAAATHTGYLRASNEDLALATSDLAAVADGMGGHLGGEVAARIAVEHLLEAYRNDRTTQGLLAAVSDANDAIYQRSRSDRSLRGMGTTLTAAALVGDEPDGQLRLALVNVGDSRGYLLDRAEKRVHKLTEDHSVVEEMVRSGELTPEEAAVHPHRHILTRVLGIEPNIETDCWELDLQPGSVLLLCSDGLTNELGEQEIAQVLVENADIESAASELVRLALQRGGTDNVTVVVVEVVADDASAESDDVVILPESVGGTPEPAVAGESDAITEAVALASAEPQAPVSPSRKPAQASVATTAPVTARRPGYTRPVVLVPQKRRQRRQRTRGDRVVTVRVALFVLVFVVVFGGAAGVVVWFNNASFFVGLDGGYVAIFQGRPGGLLWFKPSVVERTTLKPTDLLASNVVYLKQGMEESSYQAARNLVHDLSLERSRVTPDPVTTTTTTTAPAPGVTTTISHSGVTTTSHPVVTPGTASRTTTTGLAGTNTSSVAAPTTTTTTLPGGATTPTTTAPGAVRTTAVR